MVHVIQVVDSHTAGEPTRVVIDGGPDLGQGTMKDRLDRFRESYDHFRKAIVCEPRGSDVLVGALLCDAPDGDCDAGVIFFNNVGYLGMCGHGMIGAVKTLRHLKQHQPRHYRIATPVGTVQVQTNDDDSVAIENVASYRKAKDVEVIVDGLGKIVGDVAWGGNWFYLVRQPQQQLCQSRLPELQQTAAAIRTAINDNGFPDVDHIEFFGPPPNTDADSQNFVLCPGLEYDRSPCGTGTSAKLACLAADGALEPNQVWIQAGILGTHFKASYQWDDQSQQRITPTITGTACITAEAKLLIHDDDPFAWGIA